MTRWYRPRGVQTSLITQRGPTVNRPPTASLAVRDVCGFKRRRCGVPGTAPVHVDLQCVKVVEALQCNLAVGARAGVVVVIDLDAWGGHDAGGNIMHNSRLVRVGHVGDVDLASADLALALREVRDHVHTRLKLHVLAVDNNACVRGARALPELLEHALLVGCTPAAASRGAVSTATAATGTRAAGDEGAEPCAWACGGCGGACRVQTWSARERATPCTCCMQSQVRPEHTDAYMPR